MTAEDPHAEPPEEMPVEGAATEEPAAPTFDFSMLIEREGIICHFECEGRVEEWTLPKTVVRRANKAVTVAQVFDLLMAGPILGYEIRDAATNDPEFLMVPRAVNGLMERVGKSIRLAQKTKAAAEAAAAEETADETADETAAQ